MILLLETAEVLESRAERAGDTTQAALLRRRAEQHLREAETLRDILAADGAAMVSARAERRVPTGRSVFSGPSSPGRRGRT